MDKSHNQNEFRSGFVALVGRPNVGKSTLLNQVLGQKIAITANKPQTTRNRILGIHTTGKEQILFLDTPGIHKAKGRLNRYMVDQAVASITAVDVVLFLTEATSLPGAGDEHILGLLEKAGVPVILVLNKIDMVPRESLLGLIEAFAGKYDFHAIVPISAMNGDGVDALLGQLPGLLPKGPHYYPEDMVTDQPERFIVAELVREQILRQTRQEIPYGTAVVVEEFREEPDRDLVVIKCAIYVEREGHKGIVLGKQGAQIRSIGKAARHSIEALLGSKVYLELFVKVQKNWTGSDRMMREFGYE